MSLEAVFDLLFIFIFGHARSLFQHIAFSHCGAQPLEYTGLVVGAV